ncbi:hypothetical protein [Deinococcus cellulosilyticus]|uniref:Uncharacterized protein n=1 Tax=Deinococcus cellulosilyticus (strain DSM 18568 / NBRC 106333 / KACC 11606 / 5516J-15) TaxID=1223518 RepID=A0A511NAE5_DEIC1|nr:hypothetical protein [Deinococcus cellulosilyticus]GEM49468.1 hypothetical protein DC3_51030 [Deinococcus cellulosilyticus NBRC 106333 = KACC 11606]
MKNAMFSHILIATLTLSTPAHAVGLFGLTPEKLTERFGPAKRQFFEGIKTHVASVYCIKGTYTPLIWSQEDQLYVSDDQPSPLGGYTNGYCPDDAGESLFVKFEKGIAVAFAYGAPHGNTYDRGWMHHLDRLISENNALDDTTTQTFRVGTTTLKMTVYPKGTKSRLFFGTGDLASLVGVLWYGPNGQAKTDEDELLVRLVVNSARTVP